MVFSSTVFIFIFLPTFLITYYMTVIYGNIKHQNAVLILFSLIFYAYGGFSFLPILLFSILANYYFAILIDKYDNKSKMIVTLSVVFNLLILFIFKYLNLFDNIFVNIVNVLFKRNYTHFIKEISLPIGISFYTFQILSYVIDVYRKKVKANYNFFQVLLYALLFPQLIAGPIVRYTDVNNEINDRKITFDNIYLGLRRFVIGFIKKIIFANMLGNVATSALNSHYHSIGIYLAILGLICYTIQLYLDFSAYSDMAIGIGQMIGFKFPENFNHPFMSKSLSELWRRWHMTLTSFLTDYVYIPLGGSKISEVRTYINILIVFSLSGFWHGANWNFLLWGIFNAIMEMIERLFLKNVLKKIPKFLAIIYTNIVWFIGVSIFAFTNMKMFNAFIGFITNPINLNINNRALITLVFDKYFVFVFLVSVLFCTDIFDRIDKFLKTKNLVFVSDVILSILFIYAVSEMLASGYNPFIYFRF